MTAASGGPADRAEAVAALRADPATTALLLDFDGTLSPIVDVPGAARPVDGAVEALGSLAARYGVVAAVSGRPVAFLAEHLPGALALSGLYGLETVVDGVAAVRPGVDEWRPVVAEAVASAEAAGLDGVVVEAKGLSVTLHFRTRPQAAAAVTRLAADLAARTGLLARPAKMSIELHPPVTSDKGVAVRELADGFRTVLYVGDDLGDLPAFAALADLRAAGVTTVSVAVATPELPDEVRRSVDLLVDGPAGTVDLLRSLLG